MTTIIVIVLLLLACGGHGAEVFPEEMQKGFLEYLNSMRYLAGASDMRITVGAVNEIAVSQPL